MGNARTFIAGFATRALAFAAVILLLAATLFGCAPSTPSTGSYGGAPASQSTAVASASSAASFSTSSTKSASSSSAAASSSSAATVSEDGSYTSKDEVAAYIHEFGHLPGNFISKTKARKAGWVSSKGNLDEVCPGKSIGGSEFYNDEGQLPDAAGRTWKECDIGYEGGYRGSERIVFSNDGLVYYTGDHYRTFERLY